MTTVPDQKRELWSCDFLALPDELLLLIVYSIDCPRAFAALARTCQQLATIMQSPEEQERAKNRFAKRLFEPEPNGWTRFAGDTWLQLPNGARHSYFVSYTTVRPIVSDHLYESLLAIDWFDDLKRSKQLWRACFSPLELVLYINGKRQGCQRMWGGDGTLEQEIFYLDDLQHGLERQCHPTTGKCISLQTYFHGHRTGTELHWSGDGGRLTIQGEMKDGLPCGQWFYWSSETGRLISIKEHDHNGHLHGVQLEFYNQPGRCLSRREEYAHGCRQGNTEEFDQNGVRTFSGQFEKDKVHGRVVVLRREPHAFRKQWIFDLLSTTFYDHGKKHGGEHWIYSLPCDQSTTSVVRICGSGEWQNDQRCGKEIEQLLDTGEIIYEIEYDDEGRRHGMEIKRDPLAPQLVLLQRQWVHGAREGLEMKHKKDGTGVLYRYWENGIGSLVDMAM